MPLLGFLGGYASAKASLATATLGLYLATGLSGGLAIVCPATIPVTGPLTTMLGNLANASGAMLISPMDPLTATVTTTTTLVVPLP